MSFLEMLQHLQDTRLAPVVGFETCSPCAAACSRPAPAGALAAAGGCRRLRSASRGEAMRLENEKTRSHIRPMVTKAIRRKTAKTGLAVEQRALPRPCRM